MLAKNLSLTNFYTEFNFKIYVLTFLNEKTYAAVYLIFYCIPQMR